MRSVADLLRSQTVAAVRQLSASDRIRLALALGDEDLDLYVRASGLGRHAARARLQAQRAYGRVMRRVAEPPSR